MGGPDFKSDPDCVTRMTRTRPGRGPGHLLIRCLPCSLRRRVGPVPAPFQNLTYLTNRPSGSSRHTHTVDAKAPPSGAGVAPGGKGLHGRRLGSPDSETVTRTCEAWKRGSRAAKNY